nr:hypothetical protein [Bradyrhizobium sp. CCBAU 51627]
MTSARLSGSNAPTPAHIKLLDDRRFRALLSDEDWGRLPLATWRRFSKRVADGDSSAWSNRSPSATSAGGSRRPHA